MSAAPEPRGRRLAVLDVLRGVAVAAMVVYHFCWDLSAYGLIAADVVGDFGWRAFARTIAGTFVLLVGVNLVLATRGGFRRDAFLRRLAVIAGAAVLVSIGTWMFMGDSFVYFGILHCIAVSSVLALPFLRVPPWFTLIIGAGCIAAPFFLMHPVFDAPALLWIGLSPNPRPTVDYVPLLPWFGVCLIGVMLGRLYVDYGQGSALSRWQPGKNWRPVTFAGQWSLAVYLIHQPLLLGALYLAMPVIGNSHEVLARRFMEQCVTTCQQSSGKPQVCPATCGCVVTGAEGAGLLAPAMNGTMTPEQSTSWDAIVQTCLPKPPGSEGSGKT